MKKQYFPAGWNQARVQRLIDHYENLTEDEWVAEDEAAFNGESETVMTVPHELVPAVRKMIAQVYSKRETAVHSRPVATRDKRKRKQTVRNRQRRVSHAGR